LHKSINNLALINNQIKSKFGKIENLNIIAVSKTFSFDEIEPLINSGHVHFGENKVQEALEKWGNKKNSFKDLKLHMIGKLQTNKVKYAISLFDYIHSLDSIKLAEKISLEQKKINRNLKIFIQVNLGNEDQKSGIDKENLKNFYEKCTKEFQLNIVGLMCLPPQDAAVRPYFSEMKKLNEFIGLKDLSIGMSSDYLDAIDYGATFVRIGSKIFGNRS
tara:strand:+ start:129 stop:782 length:654 start_codon:yes stop_codon:yes gene_type:complete